MSDPAFPEKISHKIRLYLIVTFSAVALTGAVSIISTRNIFLSSKKINSLNQHIKIMDQFHILFHHLIDELHRAIILKTLDRQEHIRDLEQELKEQLVRYRAEHLGEIPSPEQTLEMTLVEEIQRSTAQLLSLSGSIQKLIAKRQKIPNEQFGLLDGIAHTIPPVNQQLNELHLKEIRGLIQENTSRMDMIFWIYLGFLAFGTVATVLGIRKFSTAIIHPLQLLTSATVEVGSGAQGKRIDVASKDEFGQLSHFFNEMLETLENRERELRASQKDLARHVRELEALHRINVEISGLLDLDQVLKLVVEKARELMGTDLASLCTPAADGNGFTPQTVSSPERLSGLFEANRRCTFQESSHSDLPGPECAIPLEYRRAYLSAPLKRGDHIAGVLCVGCKSPRNFTAEDVNLLQGLATQVAIAMENARIVDKLGNLATLEERERIAREMHDGLAQTLGFLYAKIQGLQERAAARSFEDIASGLKTMEKAVGEAYDEVRQSIFGLRTMVSRSLGLIPTLTEYLHEFSAQTGIQVSLNVLDEKGTRLTPTAEVQLIRIIQESLTNVRKHARSSSAIIRFDYKDGKGRIFIEDNGGGFEPSVHGKASSLHFGLQTMKERAQAAGGKLEIQSDPASGTQIIVTLPVIP